MKHPKLTKCLLAVLIGLVLLVFYLVMINLLAYMVESDTFDVCPTYYDTETNTVKVKERFKSRFTWY